MAIQPERPQSIGGVLDTTFQLYKASVLRVWPLVLLAAVGSSLPYIYVLIQGPEADPLDPFGMLTSPGYWAVNLATIILSLWAAAALYIQQQGVAVGQDPGAGAALTRSLPRVLPLFLMSLLLFLAVAVGMVLLIIPGLILVVSLILGANLVVLEGKGPIESLKGSHTLVWGNWWRATAILTVGFIVVMVAYVVAVALIGILIPIFGVDDVDAAFVAASLGGLLVGVLMTFVVTPFYVALVLALYWDLKLRKEGGDLASRVAALGPA